jgi:multisubunit Na+/H+ antiporter MnhF subunit
MQVLRAAVLYFLLVFGAGFVLGIWRALVVVPLLGERAAELLEMPLMLAVIVAAARWVVRHKLDDRLSSVRSVGFIAMGFVLLADLAVGIWLRGMSASEVFLDRDPISGAAYYAALLFFAVMPAFIIRLRQT